LTFWFLLLEVIVWSITGVVTGLDMRVIEWFVYRKNEYRQIQNVSKKVGGRSFSV